jgi:hypothetical protein
MRATDTGRPCLGHAALTMITAAVALTATACASTASSTSAAPPASSATAATTPQAAASPSESMAETAGTIGTDCGMIPGWAACTGWPWTRWSPRPATTR